MGYHLTIVKDSKCDSDAIADLVKGTVPGSEVGTDVGAELSFILPSQSSHLFPNLFDTFNGKSWERERREGVRRSRVLCDKVFESIISFQIVK